MEMGATEGFKMEKLIELIKEYNDNKEGARIGFITTIHINGVPTPYELGKLELLRWKDKIISKEYGFIKWLVENEKIDFGTRNPLFLTKLVGGHEKQIPYSFYEEMLIRLALSDTPIEDLISYLK